MGLIRRLIWLSLIYIILTGKLDTVLEWLHQQLIHFNTNAAIQSIQHFAMSQAVAQVMNDITKIVLDVVAYIIQAFHKAGF